VTLKDSFKEPTRLSLIMASILAVFQFLNSLGLMDNVAFRLKLIETVNGPNEKLIIPTKMHIWGILKPGIQDYAISAFLIYILISLWINRPVEPSIYVAKKRKIRFISVKSMRPIRWGIIFLLFGLLSTANKRGKFSEIATAFGFVKEGRIGLSGGSPGFEPIEWAIRDYAELAILYLLFIIAMWRGLKIDTSRLIPADDGTHIEKIWVNSDQSERLQRTNNEEGASRINSAFTDLVGMLSAAATLNLAAASLDEGNVKGAFNKWKNLTHKKGKQFKDWTGLSESFDDVGKFKTQDEEE